MRDVRYATRMPPRQGPVFTAIASMSLALGIGAALTSAAALAGLLPARRAARVDPMNALRCE
jgi:ABC-type lipoprotein release transport system permease subunit